MQNPNISQRARIALGELPGVVLGIRYETGECMGVFLQWNSETFAELSKDHYMPSDSRQRLLLAVLNSELRKENPHLRFEDQVEFNDEWQP